MALEPDSQGCVAIRADIGYAEMSIVVCKGKEFARAKDRGPFGGETTSAAYRTQHCVFFTHAFTVRVCLPHHTLQGTS